MNSLIRLSNVLIVSNVAIGFLRSLCVSPICVLCSPRCDLFKLGNERSSIGGFSYEV
uniref:Uncharacterized protein n=1 Tax=Picea glauca TaxID=3330 RepID=A0A101M284_PICGL|nr:hypothetical protein ABT39_MTgene2938 [Picea glauca]